MLKIFKKLTLILVILIITGHEQSGVGFSKFNKENLNDSASFTGIKREELQSLVDNLASLYDRDVLAHGAVLSIVINWEDNTVNAHATREGSKWNIAVAGGLARFEEASSDVLALLICHEIGHHLAGDPKMSLFGGWASAEGQADYWGTNICLKKYFHRFYLDKNYSLGLPADAIKDCHSVYSTTKEINVCYRVMQTANQFGKFLDKVDPKKIPISFNTPDPRIVKGTNLNDYPRSQCRFDTVYAAALCAVDVNLFEQDELNLVDHNCNELLKKGFRPRCWYKSP